jgi:hypothetical protein
VSKVLFGNLICKYGWTEMNDKLGVSLVSNLQVYTIFLERNSLNKDTQNLKHTAPGLIPKVIIIVFNIYKIFQYFREIVHEIES